MFEWETGSRGSPRAMDTSVAPPLLGRGDHTAVGMGAGDWEAVILWFMPSSKHRRADVGAGSVQDLAGNYFVE